MPKKMFLAFLMALLIPVYAHAGGEHMHTPYVGSAAFEKMKTLAGSWKGTTTTEGKTESAEVNYGVSSAGSAVVEKLFPGTDHEMVSVYNDEKGSLVMTHYCALHNQPKLKAASSDDSQIQLDWTEANGVALSEPHMHSLKVTFESPDAFTQEWAYFQDGKAAGTTVMHFERVK